MDDVGPSLHSTARFGPCPSCGDPLGIRARLDDREVTGYDLWCLRCGSAGPVPSTGPLAEALRDSLLDAEVRAARHRTPLPGDRRAWPLVHHDPHLPSPAQRLASLRASSQGPFVTLCFDGVDWVPVGVAGSGEAMFEWLAVEDTDLPRP